MHPLDTNKLSGLCGHGFEQFEPRGWRSICRACDSFWDLDMLGKAPCYGVDYAAARKHFSSETRKHKLRALVHWLKKNQLTVEGKVVCEIGFGGGANLEYLFSRCQSVYGIEQQEGLLENLAREGFPRKNLFRYHSDIELPEKIDLWLFVDSFEHILDLSPLKQLLIGSSAPNATVLLVIPDATAFSRKVMGRLWPHRTVDHQFFWSRQGLESFFRGCGFRMQKDFHPQKYFTVDLILNHLALRYGLKSSRLPQRLIDLFPSVAFNIGEAGLVFSKSVSS